MWNKLAKTAHKQTNPNAVCHCTETEATGGLSKQPLSLTDQELTHTKTDFQVDLHATWAVSWLKSQPRLKREEVGQKQCFVPNNDVSPTSEDIKTQMKNKKQRLHSRQHALFRIEQGDFLFVCCWFVLCRSRRIFPVEPGDLDLISLFH